MRVLKAVEPAGDGYRVIYAVDAPATVELRVLGAGRHFREVMEVRDEIVFVDADEGRRLIEQEELITPSRRSPRQ